MSKDIKNIKIDTPSLVIFHEKFLKNIQKLKNFFLDSNVIIRPHAKTHKCPEIAKIQIKNGAKGICVQKISEAEVFANNGINDIFLTNQVVGQNKLNRIPKLASSINFSICVDNILNLKDINNVCVETNTTLKCFIELNVGMNRCGVRSTTELNSLMRYFQKSPNLIFSGFHAYTGHLQHIESIAEREKLNKLAMSQLKKYLNFIRKKYKNDFLISGGGTGTFHIDKNENILDEIQPGSYIFMDSHYSAINNFDDSPEFEQSLYVLGSIMSINSESIILDVGTKSISIESGFPKLFNDNNAKTIQVSDEHIVIKCDTKKYKLGEKVLLIPSHCDPTVNLHEKFNIINDKLEIVDSWKILARGMHF